MILIYIPREYPPANISEEFDKDDFDYTRDVLKITNQSTCEAANYIWKNSDMNFDHVGKAYLSLLQVVSESY